MTRSSKLSLFPDINVWIALTYDGHVHHIKAHKWFENLPSAARLFFCRITQLGLLRLLTAEVVMGTDEARTQQQAWRAYDSWTEDERVEFLAEPIGLEEQFRALTRSQRASPKEWGDAYLVAFAEAAGLAVVTFDRTFQSKTKDLLLLEA